LELKNRGISNPNFISKNSTTSAFPIQTKQKTTLANSSKKGKDKPPNARVLTKKGVYVDLSG